MPKKLAVVTAVGFLALLFYYPLVTILLRGISAESFVFVLQTDTLQILWFTVWQALVSAFVSVLVGVLFAYLLYRKRFRGQVVIRALFTAGFVMPILVIAIAFNTFQISNVVFAILLSHIYINAPLVARAVGSQWVTLDREIEEAAALDGAGRFATFCRITFFQLRPALASSFVLVFIYCTSAFGTVLLLGNGLVNTLETAMYQQVFSYLDLQAATGLAVIQLLLTAALFVIANRIAKADFGLATSIEQAGDKFDLRDLWVAIPGVAILLAWLLPIRNVFQIAFGVNANFGIDKELIQAALNSSRNVAIVMLLCGLIGLLAGYLIARGSVRVSKFLSLWYLAPIGVSTVLVGLGFLVGFGSLRSSWFVIPLAETVLALPLFTRLVSGALSAIDASLLQQAKVDGANTWQIIHKIELPLIRPTLATAVGFAALIAFGDFGASAFLTFGDQDTLPILLYRLISRPGAENYQQAMFLASCFILLTVLLTMVTSIRKKSRI